MRTTLTQEEADALEAAWAKDDRLDTLAASMWRADNPDASVFDVETKRRYRRQALELLSEVFGKPNG